MIRVFLDCRKQQLDQTYKISLALVVRPLETQKLFPNIKDIDIYV